MTPALRGGDDAPPQRRVLSFGVSLPKSSDGPAFAAEAERLGFDFVACGEHLAFHGPTTNAFVSLAAAAGATTTIGLVSAITLVPLYPPALLAKLVATLDDVSGGRFVLGVGVGGEFPPEFAAVGIPLEERGRRTDEALEIVRKLLTEEEVSFDGDFTRFDSLTIRPRPKIRTPFWIAGRRMAAMKRAERFGDGWFPYLMDPARFARSVATVQELAAERGREWNGTNGYFAFLSTYPDGARARDTVTRGVGRVYRQDFSPMTEKYLVAGTPSACRDRIAEYIDAGATTLILRLVGPPEDLSQMLKTVARDVVGPLRIS
jgi:probable F420-dependent oxidoreductase